MGVRGKSPFRDYILILIGASIMGFAIKTFMIPSDWSREGLPVWPSS